MVEENSEATWRTRVTYGRKECVSLQARSLKSCIRESMLALIQAGRGIHGENE